MRVRIPVPYRCCFAWKATVSGESQLGAAAADTCLVEQAPQGQSGNSLGLFFAAVLVGPFVSLFAAMLATLLGGTSWFLDATASPLRAAAVLVLVGWGYVIYRAAVGADHSRASAAAVAVAAVLWSVAAGLLLIAVAQV